MWTNNRKILYLIGIILSLIFITLGIVDIVVFDPDITNNISQGPFGGTINFIPDWFSITLIVISSIMFVVSAGMLIWTYWMESKFKKEKERLHSQGDFLQDGDSLNENEGED